MQKTSVIFLIMVFLAALPIAAAAQSGRYVRIFRDSGYDMYLDAKTIIQGGGVTSFWIKSVYSDAAKAAVRKELPVKAKKIAIEYGMDYFQYDSKKNRYNVKMSSVYAGEKEVFREGSRKWLPLKEGSLAKAVWLKADEYLKNREK